MKIREIVTTAVLVLAIITISTTTAAALSCGDADICVDLSGWQRGGGAFNMNTTPIQAAVDNANAGDVICVAAGSYIENVDIMKQLTFRGEGADVVTVTAADAGDHVFHVTADYVNISGFNVAGTTAGAMTGIYLYGANNCNISDNTASNNGRGIYMYGSSNNTLLGNVADSNNYAGIYIYGSSNNTLANNTADSNNNYGICIYGSSDDNTLDGNSASNNNRGIYMYRSSNNTLVNNTADSNDDYGIYLYHSNNDNTLDGNSASNNNRGIFLYYCDDNTFANNTANSNTFDGIYLRYSSNNTLLGNTANSNTHGIYLDDAGDNNITCNWVHNNTDAGFYLTGSIGNTIERNNIIANGNYNDASGGWEWQFRNDQPDDVDTAGNWWDTNNEAGINASIHDWTYDASRGNVTTNLRLDGPVPCAPIPELPTALLFAVGLLMLVGYVRIRRKT